MTLVSPAITYPAAIATGKEYNRINGDQTEPKVEANMRKRLNSIPFQITRPLTISMSLFGLLHLSGKEKRWANITRIYSTGVLLLMWAMFIRAFTLYGQERFGPNFMFKVVNHVWTFLCAVGATSTYRACRRQNNIVELLTSWSYLLELNRVQGQEPEDVNVDSYVKKTTRTFYSCLIFSWLWLFGTCFTFGYNIFLTSNIDFMLTPLDTNHPQAFLIKCFLFVISIYMCAAWLFPLSLFYIIGSVICEEFRKFHADLKQAVLPNKDLVGIGNYRRRHQEICLLVEKGDDILSGFNAVSIVVTTITQMLVLYNMLTFKDYYTDLVVLLSNVLYFLNGLVYLGVIAVGGGYLNHMAHEPLQTIYNIHLKTMSTEISLQMTMFLSKLTGDPIGLTAMGMFVIDKPTILAVAGLFLTYFVVLLQFQQPSDRQNDLVNCTISGVQ